VTYAEPMILCISLRNGRVGDRMVQDFGSKYGMWIQGELPTIDVEHPHPT
jgi:hypothetical protein